MFQPMLDISFNDEDMTIAFHKQTQCSQNTEHRTLDSIRSSLLDPMCTGPKIVYGINMDVYLSHNKEDLKTRNQLYGVVLYNKGTLGKEAIRSQGHLHAISPFSGTRTGEVYQILHGEAYICMQKENPDNSIDFYAIFAKLGDIVVVHHDWIHATVNADPKKPLVFGAWCCRDYAFEYKYVKEKKGLAYYPICANNNIKWLKNNNYDNTKIIISQPPSYKEFGLVQGECIYQQYANNNNLFEFVTQPSKHQESWNNFIPYL